jgi:hypothetical protein
MPSHCRFLFLSVYFLEVYCSSNHSNESRIRIKGKKEDCSGKDHKVEIVLCI